MFSRAARTQRRLTAIRKKIAGLREESAVLEEQIAFLQMVEGDAQTDAVVKSNNIADREHRAAKSDLERTQRQRDEARRKIARLLEEQDSLLERMLD